ncbi:hypothetical protein [Methyloversatilis thermotolerans]|uniref:hypothetical protein n=1 Tax=Methyloversatilis thermotolerans TaxID=1346290 RepID=UPI000370578F|nr:hypothetical protein [Methyloversatilis thermotolerans]
MKTRIVIAALMSCFSGLSAAEEAKGVMGERYAPAMSAPAYAAGLNGRAKPVEVAAKPAGRTGVMGESLDAPAAAPTYASGLNGRVKPVEVAAKPAGRTGVMGESLDAPAAAPTYAAGLNGRAKSLAVAGKSPQMQQHPAVLAQSSRDFVVTADLATVTHPAIRHRAH